MCEVQTFPLELVRDKLSTLFYVFCIPQTISWLKQKFRKAYVSPSVLPIRGNLPTP